MCDARDRQRTAPRPRPRAARRELAGRGVGPAWRSSPGSFDALVEPLVNREGDTKMPRASVNGLDMYYEIHGEGQPLVLLHGALSATGTSFGTMLPDLARSRRVISVEQQAHGHTADVDRPLSMEQM